MSVLLTNIWTLFRRELIYYFLSPMAYVIFCVFYLANGFSFMSIIEQLNHPFAATNYSVLQYFFGLNLPFWFIMIMVPALLTMRLFSEEYQSGTIEVLMTAPVTETEVVLAKYLASLAFFVLLWVPTLVYVIILRTYSSPDLGPIILGYAGTLAIGAMFIAIGALCSAFSRNQLVSAIIAMVLTLVLFLVPMMLENMDFSGDTKALLEYTNMIRHFSNYFNRGFFDSRWFIYYASISVACLIVTVRVLRARKWRS